MLHFLKNALFGSEIFSRPNSLQVKSKAKADNEPKRPLSFDSKQKDEKDRKKTSKKQEYPEVIEFDETVTIKRYSNENDRLKEKYEYGRVSDLDDDTYQGDHLNDCGKFDEGKALSVKPEKENNNNSINCIVSSPKESQFPRSAIIPQSKKVLISRDSPKKVIRAIQEKCAICTKVVHMNESFQLACTHRFHKQCADQMRWRMRYRCDICEIKKDHKKCSIMLRNLSRCRKDYDN